jgi:hypothetical protein
MNIRNAILAAADHIESNPNEFDFKRCYIPSSKHCGTPGCALGWIGTFLAVQTLAETRVRLGCTPAFHGIGIVSSALMNSPSAADSIFYARMDGLPIGSSWNKSSDNCAAALRLYADKYHPAVPVLAPDWNAIASKRTVSDAAVDEMVRASA